MFHSRTQVDELIKVCSEHLINVLETTEENIVSLLNLMVVFQHEMAGECYVWNCFKIPHNNNKVKLQQ